MYKITRITPTHIPFISYFEYKVPTVLDIDLSKSYMTICHKIINGISNALPDEDTRKTIHNVFIVRRNTQIEEQLRISQTFIRDLMGDVFKYSMVK
jgi:hypothetical protein